jgi:signal transduction histidine kinase
MSDSETKPFSGARFWRWYLLAWLDLAGLYSVVYLIAGRYSILKAVTGAVFAVIPLALLGIGVLAVFRRLDWSTVPRASLVGTHVPLALVYGIAAAGLNHGMFRGLSLINLELFGPVVFHLEYFAWECLMGVLIYGVLAGVCYAILLQARVREQEARAARAAALQTQAELRALRAQLNPHFLFNTLHSVLALVRHDPRAAEEALEQFGDLLRYTLDTQKKGEVVALRDELAFVDNYLAIESLRLGDRLRLEIDVDDTARDQQVPAFCLQPLVENSIRHAIAPRAEGGSLSVRVRRNGNELLLEVADDGPGARPVDVDNANGLGLRLVRERLATHYGGAAGFDVGARPGGGFRVALRLPFEGTDD